MKDEVLCEACKVVIHDPITGVNHTFKRYWKRITDQFNETTYGVLVKTHMNRNDNAMSHR